MEKDNLIYLPVVTTLDMKAERVLDNAVHLEDVVVIGYDKEGEFYFASNKASGPEVLWLLKQAERLLLEVSND